MNASQKLKVTWKDVPTRTITAGGVEFAYRELGIDNPGTPVVFLIHLAAVLDNWDPRIVDGFAATHRVITFDNRGVGASSGAPATLMEDMAKDAITFIKALGLDQVDLFGFSMGGMIAQEIVLMEPQLVRKMIITGTPSRIRSSSCSSPIIEASNLRRRPRHLAGAAFKTYQVHSRVRRSPMRYSRSSSLVQGTLDLALRLRISDSCLISIRRTNRLHSHATC